MWQKAFTPLRAPKPFNMRTDPFERGDEGIYYGSWLAERMFLIVPAQAIATSGWRASENSPQAETRQLQSRLR